jgi:predicted NAD/FAD-dependent oxidoreductase
LEGASEVDARDLVTQRVAVIGAGLCGLSCARVLRRAGFFVEVFEQDRIIGGRMSTARVGMQTFDHGAPYIIARSQTFRSFIEELMAGGYAQCWTPRAWRGGEEGGGQLLPWFVGTPGMASIVRPLAESVRIHTSRRVHTIQRQDKGWHVWFDDETAVGPFQAIAICVPAPQARLLLGRLDDLSEPLTKARMSPVWALMVRLEEVLLPEQDVFSDMSEVVRWVCRNQTKPGRSGRGENLVIHASQGWSREAEEAEPEVVAEELWNEVSHRLSLPPVRPASMTAHLWRYGIVDTSLGDSYVFSTQHQVGVAGDWCLGRLGEHAFESGSGLGRAIVNALS